MSAGGGAMRAALLVKCKCMRLLPLNHHRSRSTSTLFYTHPPSIPNSEQFLHRSPPSSSMAITFMSSSSSSSKTLEALTTTILALATIIVAAAAARQQPPSPVAPPHTTTTINLTLHNLCAYPVWPLVTANAGVHSIPTDADGEPAGRRLDGNGEGLTTLTFPPGAWSGRVVARTGCWDDGDGNDDVDAFRCATGDAPPVTVAQVSVGGANGAAAYSVSLVDGFNVPVAVTPHGMPASPAEGGRHCPTLGCAVDLAAECPVAARGPGGWCGAGASQAAVFKRLCPDTRTNATDVEVTPQDCVGPGEIKVVFCPRPDSVVAGHL